MDKLQDLERFLEQKIREWMGDAKVEERVEGIGVAFPMFLWPGANAYYLESLENRQTIGIAVSTQLELENAHFVVARFLKKTLRVKCSPLQTPSKLEVWLSNNLVLVGKLNKQGETLHIFCEAEGKNVGELAICGHKATWFPVINNQPEKIEFSLVCPYTSVRDLLKGVFQAIQGKTRSLDVVCDYGRSYGVQPEAVMGLVLAARMVLVPSDFYP